MQYQIHSMSTIRPRATELAITTIIMTGTVKTKFTNPVDFTIKDIVNLEWVADLNIGARTVTSSAMQ